MDAYQQTQIDNEGEMWYIFQISDINPHLSIYQSINQQKEKNGGRDISLVKNTAGRIESTNRKEKSTGQLKKQK